MFGVSCDKDSGDPELVLPDHSYLCRVATDITPTLWILSRLRMLKKSSTSPPLDEVEPGHGMGIPERLGEFERTTAIVGCCLG